MATGVLLVCIGQATRLIEYLTGGQKIYRAAIHFGKTTNTYDADGEITASAGPFSLSEAQLQEALTQFEGNIAQVPKQKEPRNNNV
jgi:tRNA pseudouridine55 synthase